MTEGMARLSQRRRQGSPSGGTAATVRPKVAPRPSAGANPLARHGVAARARVAASPPRRPVAPSRHQPRPIKLQRPWWRSPWAWGGGTTALVAAVVIAFVVLASSAPPAAAGPDQLAPASLVSQVTGLSAQVVSSIGAGQVPDPAQTAQGSPPLLTGAGGRPELLFVGADYCPYCAAERWSVVIALSRFGSFSNLHITTSDSNPADIPDTHTFSFYGAGYSSSHLDLVAVETADRNGNALQTPSAAEQKLMGAYDTAPYSSQTDGIPFLDLGNRFIMSGSGVNPQLLQGMTWQQIVATLSDPQSQIAQQIVGNANWLTAAICEVSGDQPETVCVMAPIASLESQLPRS